MLGTFSGHCLDYFLTRHYHSTAYRFDFLTANTKVCQFPCKEEEGKIACTLLNRATDLCFS
jgi:hypothetical protein